MSINKNYNGNNKGTTATTKTTTRERVIIITMKLMPKNEAEFFTITSIIKKPIIGIARKLLKKIKNRKLINKLIK